MIVGVIGSRDFSDYELAKKILDKYEIVRIVSGGALGADSLAAQYAKEKGLKITELKPNYKKYGKGAPFIRNREIVDRADLIVAFWNGASNGTRYGINYASKRNKKVVLIQT